MGKGKRIDIGKRRGERKIEGRGMRGVGEEEEGGGD